MDIKKYSVLEGEIIDFSHEGNGLVKINDFVIFLDGGIIGDRVRFEVTRVKKYFANGKILEILEKSKDRVDIDFSESRGGIPLVELSYDKQLEWKQNKVEADLYKFGDISRSIDGIRGMENPFKYRNHVQIPVRSFNGRKFIGFYEQGSKRIIDMDETILINDSANEVFRAVKEWIIENNISAYDPRRKKGLVRHIGIRSNRDREIMLILVSTAKSLTNLDDLLERLKDLPVVSIYQNINKSNSSLVYSNNYRKIYGEDHLIDSIGDKEFYISPNSFFQVNPVQTKLLYDRVVDYLEPESSDKILDLYCGIGSISIYVADYVSRVYGVELVDAAIEDANKNKELNSTINADFICARTEDVLSKFIGEDYGINKIILDPPRKGCEEGVIEDIIKIAPSRVVYVSCNSSTMARDIKKLLEAGYELKKIEAVDMFPHTAHVECIALIQRKTI